ncbi:MAG: 16S rRNA (cytosine(1402)-N(4))-methyltransferase RsmH [Candidatus Saccharimonadales bacterium]
MLKINQNNNEHLPVLLEQVLEYLKPDAGENYLDLTAGYGGHAAAILERTKSFSSSVLIDRDSEAIKALKKRFNGQAVEIIKNDFYGASQHQANSGRKFDIIMADLGISSPHLNIVSRGFSFQTIGPLDMRMDQDQSLTAETIVNNYSQAELAGLIRRWGQDPKALAIAREIIKHRPINSTTELAKIVARCWPGHHKINPATRTFQALRIAVNDELDQLAQSLPIWIDLLAPEGRLVIISFHSLEDRLVKEIFRARGGKTYDADLVVLTKRPVTGDKQEIVFNPRARSAKLRAVVKIKTRKELP